MKEERQSLLSDNQSSQTNVARSTNAPGPSNGVTAFPAAPGNRNPGPPGTHNLPDSFPVVRARVVLSVLLLLYMAGYVGVSPLLSQYLSARLRPDYVTSSNVTVDTSPCSINISSLSNHEENLLQAEVSSLTMYYSYACTFPALVSNILMGSFSDVMGRKFLFLLPALGNFISALITSLIMGLDLNLNFFYLSRFIEGLGGSFCGFLLGSFAYTADLTPPAKGRTSAMILLEISSALAGAGSYVVSGYLINTFGYFQASLLNTSLQFTTVIMLVMLLPETRPFLLRGQGRLLEKELKSVLQHPGIESDETDYGSIKPATQDGSLRSPGPRDEHNGQNKEKESRDEHNGQNKEKESRDEHNGQNKEKESREQQGSRSRVVLQPSRNPLKYVKHIFAVYLTSGTLRRRVMACLSIVSLALMFIVVLGASGVNTLYELNAPFCWTATQIGIFDCIRLLLNATGSVVSVHVLQLCMSDVTIAAVTILPGIVYAVGQALATNSAMLYIAIAVGLTNTTSVGVHRAILSKMAGPHRQGALFASIAVVETICLIASSSLYNSIYQATVSRMRGAVFFVMAAIRIIPVMILMLLMILGRGVTSEELCNQESDIQRETSKEDSISGHITSHPHPGQDP